MVTRFTCTFTEPEAVVQGLVGGKGANLAALTAAGFNVPPGFCVTTEAYTTALRDGPTRDEFQTLVSNLGFTPEALEDQTARIRKLITSSALPPVVASAIADAYRKLGDRCYVAVRSSGTAEDLAEASFAGLHDTFLDMRGVEAVLEAVKACWASMWTSRATAYRHDLNFDQWEASLAVVVQVMVEPEVSGVMFLGNPITTATDEYVINASWGLGEAVVAGSTTPDMYVVNANNLTVTEQTVGSKEFQIIRDPESATGSIKRDVESAKRSRLCLLEEQVSALAMIGRRIQEHYREIPQDVEWALAGDTFYVLQSRPITGVEFSWDADLEVSSVPAAADTVWTRALADECSTGVITPLMYSIRYGGMYSDVIWPFMADLLGLPEMAAKRAFKYYKGEVYYNCEYERIWVQKAVCGKWRANMLHWLPEAWHQDVLDAPFSWAHYARTLARIALLEPQLAWTGAVKQLSHWREHRIVESTGLAEPELRRLSDRELIRYIEGRIQLEAEAGKIITFGFFFYFFELMNMLGWMVNAWYTGPNRSAFVDLVSGSDETTDTQRENRLLSELAEEIRGSEVLTEAFENHQDGTFFTALEHSTEGRAFLAHYHDFLRVAGHRGSSDRDLFYSRRSEDPSLDYQSFRVILSGPPVDHDHHEAKVNQRRHETYDEVLADLRRKPLGGLRAELFKLTYQSVHRFLAMRDNERCNPTDLITMSEKRAFLELGHRLVERGVLDGQHDVLYLGRHELYPVFLGTEDNMPLVAAKIAARKRDILRFDAKEIRPPMHIQHGRAVDLSAPSTDTDGGLRGTGTSPGVITGTARVVKSLSDIGRVKKDEILVVNATDPAWTPAFLVISGIVVETGGMLAHASCLAREYGLPAVQVPDAMSHIPDGATITVDGGTGVVKVLE